jgi:4-amino-4-deoxy-L-arabinose transferase-like glycosyltransferase
MFHFSIFHSRYAWWLGLLGIVIITGALYFLSYRFSLPYIDHPDEPNYYLAGQEQRGLFDNIGYYENVPPGYMLFHAALQPALESAGVGGLSATTGLMRLLSIFFSLGTLVFIALTVRLAGGDLGGLVAGTAWGLAPLVFENGVYALPNPPIYLMVALALWLAVSALIKPERAVWCVWSVIAGLVAVVLRYPMVPALAPGFIVALVIFARQRRLGLRLLALQILLIGATAFWIIFVYGVDFRNLQRYGAVVRDQGITNMLNFNRAVNNIYHTILPLSPLAFGIYCGLGAVAFLIAKRRGLQRVQIGVAGLCLLLIITIPWLINTFNEIHIDTIRYSLPATVGACILMGMGLQQIVFLLPKRWFSGVVVALPLILLVFIPQLQNDWRLVQNRRLPDTRVALREWFDVNLEPGTVLVDAENHKTFNPIWGGIPYRRWVDWIVTDDVMQHSAAEWREEQGISYMQISRFQIEELNRSENGRTYLAQLLHLRDFFTPPPTRGPEMGFYRLWRMENETQIQFGEHIVLSGYDQSATQIKPGENLSFRFYWQPQGTPDDNYSLFIHLVPIDVYEIIAQADGAPAVPERPTLTWNEPSETLISPAFNLAIPADLAPGTYRIFIGLYNYTTLQRLTLEDGSDAWMMGEITVSD